MYKQDVLVYSGERSSKELRRAVRVPLAILLAGSAQAVLAAEPASTSTSSDRSTVLEEVVVTGVMTGTQLEEAPIAISAIDAEQLEKLAPVSAADLLKNVPGVFVNSSLGEIRNVVFSRGVSANSLDAGGGYYYVSLQEDGLPVSNVTFVNYGPDYLYRPDITLGRLEALRGGTATVTGPNAPGGIFNYISRTGATDPGMEVRARYGLEGDGNNPFYRADVYLGDRIGNSNLSYSFGGFYRESEGARYPGYPMNKGGQFKMNLTYEMENGSLQVYGKYLNDRNAWFEFLPAKNFNDPKLVSGIDSSYSFLPPSAPHPGSTDGGASFFTWNGSNLAHSQSTSLGFKADLKFGDGWSWSNNLKYADNKVDWNTGAVIFPVDINDFFNYIQLNTLNPSGAGTYTFRNRRTGQVAAQVVSATGQDHTVTFNALPNQQVLQNGILTQAALNSHPEAREWMDQMSVSKEIEDMTFTLGAFVALSDTDFVGGGAGFGFSPIENQPQMFDITLTQPNGNVLQLTDPSGFANLGNVGGAGSRTPAKQKQYSLFFGHNWQTTEALSIDWGVRYENMRVKGSSTPGSTPAASNATGGVDGNPNTFYDNFVSSFQAPLHYSKRLDFFNYTASASYRFTESQFGFVRYSDGKKAPDLGFYQGLNTPFELTLEPVPQHIQQFEFGYRLTTPTLRLSVSPFYSKLSDIGAAAAFTDERGDIYANPPLYSTTETLGVELESDIDMSPQFNVRVALTLQNPQSKDFRTWIANTPVRSDDSVTAIPDGDADNNPKVLGNVTLNYQPLDQFSSFVTYRYIGKRAANRFNTWYMPGFGQVDLGATYRPAQQLSFMLNVNNVLDEDGVMSWAKAGTFLTALDRQSFTPADLAANPNQTFNVLMIQPRAYFLSATYKF